jgi:RNase adaptor protein for sRNA GlmZ degradation
MTTYQRLVVTDRFVVHICSVALNQHPDALKRQTGWVKFDCRKLNNPRNVPSLRQRMGTDPAIVNFIQTSPTFATLWKAVKDKLDYCCKNGGELNIAFVCKGGKHRSVALTELAYQYLLNDSLVVL